MFRFVVRQSKEPFPDLENRGEASEAPPWRELIQRWTQENPDQKYTRESRFKRDFQRGGRAVLSPYDESELWTSKKLSVP